MIFKMIHVFLCYVGFVFLFKKCQCEALMYSLTNTNKMHQILIGKFYKKSILKTEDVIHLDKCLSPKPLTLETFNLRLEINQSNENQSFVQHACWEMNSQ